MKDLNEFAREVTLIEGGKVEVNIAQVKEVLRIAFDRLMIMPLYEVVNLLEGKADKTRKGK